MPRSFLIKKHPKAVQEVVNGGYSPEDYHHPTNFDGRMDKPLTPISENINDSRGPYDLSLKSSRRSGEVVSVMDNRISTIRSTSSALSGPSPPPTPPSSSEKSITPPPGIAMISSKPHSPPLFMKSEMEAASSWHRPQGLPSYLPFNFPLYAFPNRVHPAYQTPSISPTHEGSYYGPPKYVPATHLMPLSPPRSNGSVPTVIRPEPQHHQLSPRLASPKDVKVMSPAGSYYNIGSNHSPPHRIHYLPPQGHLLQVPQNQELIPPTFCSTTPPWSSNEESILPHRESRSSPSPSTDSESSRENSLIIGSMMPDSKRRRTTGPSSIATSLSPNSSGEGGPRYQCTECSKNYSTYSGLSKHRQFHCAQTQNKKSFSCKYCEKVYVSLGALKMHIRTHTLPCKCKLCGKAFSRPWLLQGHIRTHTGEKPFACSHCSRAFADRSNLRAHLQTHSDVKKYSCKACSKTFSRMSLLLKHEDGGCVAAQQQR